MWLDIAHEGQAGLGTQGLDATGEGFVGHVVLEDIDQGLVDPLLAREFVEGHQVPVADQADLVGAVVDEELGHGDLAAGDQDAVGRELRVDVALARPLRSQLDQVVVALTVGHQADQLQQLAAPPEERGIKADALHQQSIHSSAVKARRASKYWSKSKRESWMGFSD